MKGSVGIYVFAVVFIALSVNGEDEATTKSSFHEDKIDANFTYGEKKPAMMSCNITSAGDPKDITKVEWLKNNTLVSELGDASRFTQIEANNTLIISEPTRQDADVYFARFHFKDGSSPHDCKVIFTAAPLVLKFDKSKNLIEGDTMELRCQVKGYPYSKVSWRKDEKLLNMSDDGRVKQSPLHGHDNALLIISNVEFTDAGDYECTAYSTFFNASDSKGLVVRVKDKLAALWPFLGIVGEVVVLCIIIFIYEKRRNKQAENEANEAQDVDGSISDKKEGLRHRNTSNPTA